MRTEGSKSTHTLNGSFESEVRVILKVTFALLEKIWNIIDKWAIITYLWNNLGKHIQNMVTYILVDVSLAQYMSWS